MTPAHVGSAPLVTRRQRRKVSVALPAAVRCPYCASASVRRLHRNWMERVLTKVTGSYPHICKECSCKFSAMIVD